MDECKPLARGRHAPAAATAAAAAVADADEEWTFTSDGLIDWNRAPPPPANGAGAYTRSR